MSERTRELAERRAKLQLRSAAQRREIAREARAVEGRLKSADRLLVIGRAVLGHPAVIAVGLVALLLLGRTRALRLAGQAVLLVSGMRGLLRSARKVL